MKNLNRLSRQQEHCQISLLLKQYFSIKSYMSYHGLAAYYDPYHAFR